MYSIALMIVEASSVEASSVEASSSAGPDSNATAVGSSAATVRPTVSGLIGGKAVIAVVEIHDAGTALGLSAVLTDEGIDALEITLRTPVALQAIELAAGRAALPVGAGTIVRPCDADRAVACGAQFLASPGYDPTLVDHADGLQVPLLPGVITPSEIQTALRDRFTEVKLFPAGQFGGIKLVDAVAPLFPDVSFVPTGGVNLDNVGDYLRHPSVTAVGGSFIAPADLINHRAWNEIARRARSVRNLQAQITG
ncbi:MAG: bifunctional 4-hydroxy-2-oxoglutarate aldolase/2-dehydro-3-deoxy-phosphogluconate aldolase [Acidimicrobiaceae bacterium]|nr:bifunctional 4-hydroxy-2-oxoglutarate aldolase/2-dehydro-3-deoxy-phosphogluconate aldolase [Acidimicrobiaceae bacterium]